ncbi:hypothetical protein NC652_024389 [Populus alba x Populus x berolinensis]|nr:hypothetical protein NC652_024389 [Populus alba x Populus x berolinensis]
MVAAPGSPSSAEMSVTDVEEEEEEKSEIYSHNMTEAMGLTPEDVDKLRKIGVKTVFCLQQDQQNFGKYFGVRLSVPFEELMRRHVVNNSSTLLSTDKLPVVVSKFTPKP